jgi:hypothetical protein
VPLERTVANAVRSWTLPDVMLRYMPVALAHCCGSLNGPHTSMATTG